MEKQFLLNNNWEFSLFNVNEPFDSSFKIKKNKWFTANVPGTIHTDLLQNKIIPDPFYADYEKYLQWIGLQDWAYRTTFDLPGNFDINRPILIHFNGLDTIAEISLNDKVIANSENMFCALEVNISDIVKEENNILEILFRSPVIYAQEQEKKHGKLPVALNSERVYIRKAQYSFGWDWGPSFATSGIWRSVLLLQPETSYIKEYSFTTLEIKKNSAELQLKAEIISGFLEKLKLELQLFDDTDLVFKQDYEIESSHKTLKFVIESPELWFPNGYGDPHLYKLRLKLIEGTWITDTKESFVGIRKIELQLKENSKDTFRFVVNGKPIFARGVNWIPSDSFIPRITDEKYKQLLQLAADADMNIVRVWGGGFYENEIFYDLCDKFGLLVWQDFMFACASYPTHNSFIKNITSEFEYNIKRIRNHPSLAIWCGNNENEWIWYQEQKRSFKEMPGYSIYNKIIPEKLKELDPTTAYWQSSPFSNEEDPNSPKSGNRHQWQLWSMWTDYNNVFKDESLFVTEFGFQGPANKSTLEKVIPAKSRSVQSELFEFHNKQVEGNERIFRFMASHLPVKTDWDSYLYLAQLNQGLALSTCLLHWRSRESETNGSIIWQLNDCWPVSSWSLIDSDLIPKLSYYMVKNVFSQQIIIFRKNINKNKTSSLSIFFRNSSYEPFTGTVNIKILKLNGGHLHSLKKINLKKTKSQEELLLTTKFDQENSIIIATICDENKNRIHRAVYKEKEWKHLKLPKSKVKLFYDKKKNLIKITASEPSFYISLAKENTRFSKNGFILLPGEEEILTSEMTSGSSEFSIKDIEINSLNDFLH